MDSELSAVRLGRRMLRLVPSVFCVRKASSIVLYFSRVVGRSLLIVRRTCSGA